jgi:hypothetical protein
MEQERPLYQFEVEDEKEWMSYLEDNGFVVVKSVGSPGDVEKAKEMFWNTFEEQNTELGLKRDDVCGNFEKPTLR